MFTATDITAGEIMDRTAVLMNDPAKTDYTYLVLLPYLGMALDELMGTMLDSHSPPLQLTSTPILITAGTAAIWPSGHPFSPNYPSNLIEIQEIGERKPGTNDKFIPLVKYEFLPEGEPYDMLAAWAWEDRIIKFKTRGATVDKEVYLKYLRHPIITGVTSEHDNVGTVETRAYLAFKTAAFAAMFIGENPERAAVLDAKAEASLEQITSIQNKGKQQIMTRHRPFRAAYKARGGW